VDRARILNYGAIASAGVALVGAIGTLLAEGPYLSVSKGIEAWLGVYAIGLLGLLLFAPFALHRRIAASTEDRDRRWELAVTAWGGIALAGCVVFALVLWVGPGPSEPLGAIALTSLLACALIVGSVLLLMLTAG
jgi:hypothetical protein